MVARIKNTTPAIVMIDYYDGVTEGVLREFVDGNSYYFKLIAWDSFQDKRLFALKSIDNDILSQFYENKFQKISQKKLIDLCRKELVNSELLVLGDKIDADSLRIFNMDGSLNNKVISALSKDDTDNLDDFMPLLIDQKE